MDFSSSIRPDIQVPVWKGSTSSFQPGGEIEKSFDGDMKTMYHSNWNNKGENYFPITLTYQFKDADKIDYLVYYPRQTGYNGHFKEVEVQYTTKENTNFTKFGDFDFKGNGSPSRVSFNGGLINPTSIRFIVKSGAGDGQGFASCAQMQFYCYSQQDKDFEIFKDPLLTQLRDDVTRQTIESCTNPLARYLGEHLLDGTYSTKYRVNSFKPIYSPSRLGQILHIGNGYSRYQHVTGIVFDPGTHIVLVHGLKSGSSVGLRVAKLYAPDQEKSNQWGLQCETISLGEGFNVIQKVDNWSGLVYVDYYFDDPSKENEIQIHFFNAKVNGYFDLTKQDTNSDWDNFLNDAIYPIIDAVGHFSHLAYPVDALKKFASGKGVDLVTVYDELVSKQHEIIGLKKYKKVPQNKIFARVNYAYYMFRDGDGVAFKYDTMKRVADPLNMRNKDEDACWGFSHEVGHVHQLAPYLSWGGLGETSNNICSRYCTQSFGYKNRLLSAFSMSIEKLRGNKMAGEKSQIREKGEMTDTKIYSIEENEDFALSYLEVDVFERLVPFWRLHCYFVKNGYPDFYPDLFEVMRSAESRHPELASLNRNENVVPFQLNFIKEASLLSHLNLYPYFEAYGFFRLLTLKYDDYATFTYKMTREMRDRFRDELDALVADGTLKKLSQKEVDEMVNADE